MKCAKFEKVSYEQFVEDCISYGYTGYSDNEYAEIYENIKLPKRTTSGSAGYDFYSPLFFIVNSNTSCVVPTGIRAKIDPGCVLLLMPRSSLGFKYGMHLNNTIGVIDSDYYFANNEGHIMASFSLSNKDKELCVDIGDRFMQGIFLQYYIADEEEISDKRIGGLGSTGVK